jgi:hypothetical protein
MREHRVRCLLMGGQACVFYGAAEFSRDTDLVILPDAANLARLFRALQSLRAESIAVPPSELRNLKRGHALHFRCHHDDAPRMRVDVMARMRGVAPFPSLWKRRMTVEWPGGGRCDLLSLPDLVKAKKTQRDKDWPMIRRLLEAHYFQHRPAPNPAQIRFWLLEMRTPELLLELAGNHAAACRRLAGKRPLLLHAIRGSKAALERALGREERMEREKDRRYWRPLRKELETMRRKRLAGRRPPEQRKK